MIGVTGKEKILEKGLSLSENSTLTASGDTSLRPSLSKEHLVDLCARGREVRYKKGETLFLRNDPGDHVVILVEGLIEISLVSAAGRKSVLAHVGPDELIGEIAVIDGAARSTDCMALKACRAVLVRRATFLSFLSENATAMEEMLQALCARIRNASDMFETQSLTSASARLARCILLLARKWGQESDGITVISQSFSQSELGALAGLARENVNRHLRLWAAEDIVLFERGQIKILNMNALIDESEAADG